MAKKNRTCAVCQKTYSYCPNCAKNNANPQPLYRVMFDTENCYNIFETLSAYSCKQISEEEAKAQLNNYDLSEQKTFRKDSVRVLNELYGKERKNLLKKADN